MSDPAHGTLTLNVDGSFVYTPVTDYFGPDSFTYQAIDGQINSNTATVYIDITIENVAPVAYEDTYSVVKDNSLIVAAPGVLGNDTDINGDELTAIKVSDPAYGSLTFNSDGSFTYTPNSGYTGSDNFTYQAYDGQEYSNIAMVTITVAASAPVTFGLDGGDTTWVDSPNYLSAVRLQNTAGTGTLTKIEILCDDATPTGKVRLGVYADNGGVPGSLLLDAGVVDVTNGWVAIDGLALSVTEGSYYWLVYGMQNENGVRYQRGQSANSNRWVSYAYGPFPEEFPSSNSDNTQTVMRATVLVSGP